MRALLTAATTAALASAAGCSSAPNRMVAPPASTPAAGSMQKPTATVHLATVAQVDRRLLDVARRPGGRTRWLLPAVDGYGTHTTVLVTGRSGRWVQVALPTRPNGIRGWVAAAGVRLRSDPWRIAVSLRHRRLMVEYAGRVVRHFPAAVGTPADPTPRGVFYVTDVIRTTEPAYAPFALALSGFSPTLSEFGGGNGQVAIHGTDEAGSIGHRASHGCVRLHPAAARYLGRTIPAGTPVEIR